jgi:hypothetical protein
LPIRWRLTLFIALAIGVTLLALGLTLYLLIRGMLHKDVEATAKNRVEAVASAIEAGDELSTAPDDDDQILFDDSVAVIVRGKNGKVSISSISRREAQPPISTCGARRSKTGRTPLIRVCAWGIMTTTSTP